MKSLYLKFLLQKTKKALIFGNLFFAISLCLAGRASAADFKQLDRALARAIAASLRSAPTLFELVRRESSNITTEGVDARDALAQRQSVAALMDRLRKNAGDDDALDDPVQADALLDVLRSLDAMRQFEKGRSLDNDLPAVTDAIWSRYVATAVAEAIAKRIEPVAPEGKGQIAGQWVDGGKSNVRIIELWADERTKSLAWSRAEFAERIPNVETILGRGLSPSPKPERPRLALYIDLAGRPASERELVERSVTTSASGSVLYVLDDSSKRMSDCLAASFASKTKSGFHELTPKSNPRSKENVNDEDEALAAAKEICIAKTQISGFDQHAVLFDPQRKIRLRSINLSSGTSSLKSVLAQTKMFARIWP